MQEAWVANQGLETGLCSTPCIGREKLIRRINVAENISTNKDDDMAAA